jgi:hypothetical protein
LMGGSAIGEQISAHPHAFNREHCALKNHSVTAGMSYGSCVISFAEGWGGVGMGGDGWGSSYITNLTRRRTRAMRSMRRILMTRMIRVLPSDDGPAPEHSCDERRKRGRRERAGPGERKKVRERVREREGERSEREGEIE